MSIHLLKWKSIYIIIAVRLIGEFLDVDAESVLDNSKPKICWRISPPRWLTPIGAIDNEFLFTCWSRRAYLIIAIFFIGEFLDVDAESVLYHSKPKIRWRRSHPRWRTPIGAIDKEFLFNCWSRREYLIIAIHFFGEFLDFHAESVLDHSKPKIRWRRSRPTWRTPIAKAETN